MHRPLSYLACLWATTGSLVIASEFPESRGSCISLINTMLMTFGGTLILLYQRKLSIDREIAHNSDQVISKAAFNEVHARLDAVMLKRDYFIEQLRIQTERSDQLFQQLTHLVELNEKNRCVFPLEDGTARCAGRENPP
jgi:hypothetical protein